MPVLSTADVTLVGHGDEGTYFDNNKESYSPFQMNMYAVEARVPDGNPIFRLLPNRSRPLWEAQDPEFVEQLKTLFVSQYIAGQRLVVE